MYEYNNEFDWVNAHLTTDEYVLWRGKPVPGHIFSRVVTNRRILCRKKNSIETLVYQNIPEFYTTLNKDGSGTIFFGPRYYGTRGHQGRAIPFSMENIPEMNTVLKMISEQKRI